MTSDIKVGSPEYKRLLRRYNDLVIKGNLTPSEQLELRSLGKALDAAELAHGEARGEAGQ